MQDIKLSACIPTYNRPDYLKCAIQSLLNQSEPVDEIIVVDDGALEETKKVVEQFSMSQRIRYHRLDRPVQKSRYQTIAEPFNFCIDKASGDFVSIVGDDDLVSYDWCRCIKKAIRGQAENADIFYFSMSVIDEKNRIKRVWRQGADKRILAGGAIFSQTSNVFGLLGNFIFKKDFLLQCGKYSLEYSTFFDKEFYCRLGALKARIYFCDENIFFCRAHRLQTSHTLLHDTKDIGEMIDRFCENSRIICRINDRYRDFFVSCDKGLRYFNEKKFWRLFATLGTNSLFFKEISFLFVQGLYKALKTRQASIYKKNAAILEEYFPSCRFVLAKIFLVAYFLRYWVGYINIVSRFCQKAHLEKDPNLQIFIKG